MSTLAHKLDRVSGGCVCGSAWSVYYSMCDDSVREFGQAWLEAQDHWTVAAYADYDSEPYECRRGHDRCSRC